MDIQYIRNRLKAWFSFPQNKLFCQVSTTTNKISHIRTMDLYEVTDNGELIFLTDTNTRKWLDLEVCPNIAVCILHLDYGQIIAEGEAVLKTAKTDYTTVNLYWQNFLDQYWRDFYLSRVTDSSEKIPASFGVIAVTPCRWEVLEFNKDDFLQSSRKQFELKQGTWLMQDLLPV